MYLNIFVYKCLVLFVVNWVHLGTFRQKYRGSVTTPPSSLRWSVSTPSTEAQMRSPREGRWPQIAAGRRAAGWERGVHCRSLPPGTLWSSDPELRWSTISSFSHRNNKSQLFDSAPHPRKTPPDPHAPLKQTPTFHSAQDQKVQNRSEEVQVQNPNCKREKKPTLLYVSHW